MTVKEYLINKGLKVWEKGNNERIYINDLEIVGISEVTINPKAYRKVSCYYDCKTDEFVFSGLTSSRKETANKLVELIRNNAQN